MPDNSLGNALNIGASALQGHARALEHVASNVAHSRTRGYAASRPGHGSSGNGTVALDSSKTGTETGLDRPSDVDLATEIVDSILIRHGYKAALEVVKAADKLLEETLSLV